MNNCILQAKVVQDPQLRYTPDNQTPIAEMMIEFPGLRDNDPPVQLKVLGWGNLAQQMQETYHFGNWVIVEGRLQINTIERDQFKEKRAQLTAARIHLIASGSEPASAPASAPEVQPSHTSTKRTSANSAKRSTQSTSAAQPTPVAAGVNYDEIPY